MYFRCAESLNKGRGNTPPSRSLPPSRAWVAATAQQRKGEYSPFKMWFSSAVVTPPSAQQRKGEYSPFKAQRCASVVINDIRSTKEGGILPLQAVFDILHEYMTYTALGEYSPFLC